MRQQGLFRRRSGAQFVDAEGQSKGNTFRSPLHRAKFFTPRTQHRRGAKLDSVSGETGAAAAEALGRELETMGYNLDCESFITRGSSGDLEDERYATTQGKQKGKIPAVPNRAESPQPPTTEKPTASHKLKAAPETDPSAEEYKGFSPRDIYAPFLSMFSSEAMSATESMQVLSLDEDNIPPVDEYGIKERRDQRGEKATSHEERDDVTSDDDLSAVLAADSSDSSDISKVLGERSGAHKQPVNRRTPAARTHGIDTESILENLSHAVPSKRPSNSLAVRRKGSNTSTYTGEAIAPGKVTTMKDSRAHTKRSNKENARLSRTPTTTRSSARPTSTRSTRHVSAAEPTSQSVSIRTSDILSPLQKHGQSQQIAVENITSQEVATTKQSSKLQNTPKDLKQTLQDIDENGRRPLSEKQQATRTTSDINVWTPLGGASPLKRNASKTAAQNERPVIAEAINDKDQHLPKNAKQNEPADRNSKPRLKWVNALGGRTREAEIPETVVGEDSDPVKEDYVQGSREPGGAQDDEEKEAKGGRRRMWIPGRRGLQPDDGAQPLNTSEEKRQRSPSPKRRFFRGMKAKVPSQETHGLNEHQHESEEKANEWTRNVSDIRREPSDVVPAMGEVTEENIKMVGANCDYMIVPNKPVSLSRQTSSRNRSGTSAEGATSTSAPELGEALSFQPDRIEVETSPRRRRGLFSVLRRKKAENNEVQISVETPLKNEEGRLSGASTTESEALQVPTEDDHEDELQPMPLIAEEVPTSIMDDVEIKEASDDRSYGLHGCNPIEVLLNPVKCGCGEKKEASEREIDNTSLDSGCGSGATGPIPLPDDEPNLTVQHSVVNNIGTPDDKDVDEAIEVSLSHDLAKRRTRSDASDETHQLKIIGLYPVEHDPVQHHGEVGDVQDYQIHEGTLRADEGLPMYSAREEKRHSRFGSEELVPGSTRDYNHDPPFASPSHDASTLTPSIHTNVTGQRSEANSEQTWDNGIDQNAPFQREVSLKRNKSRDSVNTNPSVEWSAVGEVEHALMTLRKHAARLGVKESELLLAIKSDEQDEDDASDTESVRTMTFAEEILDMLNLYVKK